ncbi:MAG: phosphoribosyl-ATP diphosphatase [Raoultibacter sp.]
MSDKTFVPAQEIPPASQIGATLESLASTLAARRDAGAQSYTFSLLTGSADAPLKKLMEEAGEVALAAKDVEAVGAAALDHLRYEAADVLYHLLVVLERYHISLDEFSAELNTRMTVAERPVGGVQLYDEYVKRGK